MKRLFFLWLVIVATPVLGQTFSLKNQDPTALFCYWIIPDSVRSRPTILGNLALALGGRRSVAPGERVSVLLPQGSNLVAVFVPWTESLTPVTVLSGGFILVSEVPPRGTLLVDRPTFLAFNRGRILEATLDEWGIPVPRMVLDGRSSDWDSVVPLVEWGPSFAPEGAWPSGIPRPQSLQAVEREGGLWVRFTLNGAISPGSGMSLLLQRPGAAFEWVVSGIDSRVFVWDESGAQTVGALVRFSGGFEAWIPGDRLAEGVLRAWKREPAAWTLGISERPGAPSRTIPLAPFSWDDLP